MKTGTAAPTETAAAVVRLAERELGAEEANALEREDSTGTLVRARTFAEPLLEGQILDTGEDALAHADGVAGILAAIGGAPSLRAAAYLVYAGDYLQRPEETVAKAFGPSYAGLVEQTRKLVQVQRTARAAAQMRSEDRAQQTERVRKMLLAFGRDLRVVLLRLASRLQTLRWFAASRQPVPPVVAEEAMQVFAPLANRLGIWQVKWELEDLAFRFLQPEDYQRIARQLAEKRTERESGVEQAREQLARLLTEAGVGADVQGRPKHLYSIWKKMQGKHLAFERVLDLRALRVIVDDIPTCYAVLARVHERWPAVAGEFDDYIARPKPNGYQSLHTVVLGDDGRPVEVQIRTHTMHEHAEHGVAAHWMYKEAGARGYAGVAGLKGGGPAAGEFEEKVAEARRAVLRELLAWERDVSHGAQAGSEGEGGQPVRESSFSDRIYVFTPQATIIDLPAGGTPVDFAYSLHTELGHRCRGARVDGRVVPLNTALSSGQTVEVIAAKEGGPSLDWLNPELGYLKSPRARAKVRAWFNAQAMAQTIARGREAVEKLLQREGRTALKLDALAEQLGFRNADALFEVVGKDEFSLRNIENLLRPAEPPAPVPGVALHRPRAEGKGGVLVVGIDSLLTSLARCCRPAPPDAIGGFVTRGKGVAIHRAECSNFRHMAGRSPERVIEVQWGERRDSVYPLDVLVEAADRPGLLRDISEVFAKEKMNVTAMNSQALRDGPAGAAGGVHLTFTVEVADTARLGQALAQVARVPGVRHARRK